MSNLPPPDLNRFKLSRRDFLKLGGAALLGVAADNFSLPNNEPPPPSYVHRILSDTPDNLPISALNYLKEGKRDYVSKQFEFNSNDPEKVLSPDLLLHIRKITGASKELTNEISVHWIGENNDQERINDFPSNESALINTKNDQGQQITILVYREGTRLDVVDVTKEQGDDTFDLHKGGIVSKLYLSNNVPTKDVYKIENGKIKLIHSTHVRPESNYNHNQDVTNNKESDKILITTCDGHLAILKQYGLTPELTILSSGGDTTIPMAGYPLNFLERIKGDNIFVLGNIVGFFSQEYDEPTNKYNLVFKLFNGKNINTYDLVTKHQNMKDTQAAPNLLKADTNENIIDNNGVVLGWINYGFFKDENEFNSNKKPLISIEINSEGEIVVYEDVYVAKNINNYNPPELPPPDKLLSHSI